MIFSAQGLLHVNPRMPAEGSSGSVAANAGEQFGAAGSGADGGGGIDFLNLLVRAAGTGNSKNSAAGFAGSKPAGAGAEELKEQLLDFLESNLPEGSFAEGRGTLYGVFSGNMEVPDLLDALQAGEKEMPGLLQALSQMLQNLQHSPGHAGSGRAPDAADALRAFFSSKANPGAGVAGGNFHAGPKEGGPARQAVNQAAFQAASDADEIAAGHIRRSGGKEAGVRAGGADSGETDALGRLRAFLKAAGQKAPEDAGDALSRGKGHPGNPHSGTGDAKGDDAAQLRENSPSSRAGRIFQVPDPRDIIAQKGPSAEGAKGSRDTGSFDMRQFLAAAGGEKDPEGIKAVLSAMKEDLRNAAKTAPQMTRPLSKSLNPDQVGHETPDGVRTRSGGWERPQALTNSMRPQAGAFERQFQVEENRLVNQVSLRLSTGVRQGARSMTINMHPPELGSVKVRIVAEGGGLQVHLHSQNQQVAGILERHLPGLHQSLADQGVSVSDLQVSVDSGDDQGGSRFEEQGFGDPAGHAASGQAADEDEAAGTAADPEPVPASGGRQSGLSLRV